MSKFFDFISKIPIISINCNTFENESIIAALLTLPEIDNKNIVVISSNSAKLNQIAGKPIPENILIDGKEEEKIKTVLATSNKYDFILTDLNKLVTNNKVIYINSDNGVKFGFNLNEIHPQILNFVVKLDKLLPLILVRYNSRHLILGTDPNLISQLNSKGIKYVCINSDDNDKEKEGKSNMFSKDVSYKVCIINGNIKITYLKEVENIHVLNKDIDIIFYLDKVNKPRLSNNKINLYTYFDYKYVNKIVNYDYKLGFIPNKGFCVLE